jgi:streptogramin lyase
MRGSRCELPVSAQPHSPLRVRNHVRSRIALLAALVAIWTLSATPARADPAFTQIRQWGSDGSAPGQFHFPAGIAVAPEGDEFVLDSSNQRVERFDARGEFISMWGSAGSADGELLYPKGIALAPDGTILVADTANDRVQRFRPDGAFRQAFGSGSLSQPAGLAVTASGDIIVADRGHDRIAVFDAAGTLLRAWSGDGPVAFNKPHHVAIAGGAVYVADRAALRRFDADGQLVWERRDSGYDGGLATDGVGNLYAGRGGIAARVEQITPDGALIGSFGAYGSGENQFQNPFGLALDCRSNVFVVDAYLARAQKFGSLPESFAPCPPPSVQPPEPAPVPPPPATVLPPPPPPGSPPTLRVRARSPQHLGRRRTVMVLVSCDQDCQVHGRGRAAGIRLHARAVSVARGTFVALRFPLSRRLVAVVKRRRAVAVRIRAEGDNADGLSRSAGVSLSLRR